MISRFRWLFVAAALASTCVGPAAATDENEVKAQIEALVRMGKEGRNLEVARGAVALRRRVEDTRNFDLLQKLYQLLGIAAFNLKDQPAQLLGRYHQTLLSYRANGVADDETALALSALAMSFDQVRRDRPLQIAASQSLATIAALKARAPLSPKLQQHEVWMRHLLGESHLREGRPALALHHLTVARQLAAPIVRPDSLGGLDGQIADLRAKLSRPADLTVQDCMPRAEPTADRHAACLLAADLALLDARDDVARRLLQAMVSDATARSMRDEQVSAVLSLYMMDLRRAPASAPDHDRSALILGHKLAPVEHDSAALLAMRAGMSAIEARRPDPDLADLLGHVARRAAREGNDDIAIRLLDTQVVLLQQGFAATQDAAAETALRIERTLVLLDAASFARINGYRGLADLYGDAAEGPVAALAQEPFAGIAARLEKFADPARGFVFPSKAAAIELLGRIAMREPREPGRADAILSWIAAEISLRDDQERASLLLRNLLPQTGDKPGLERLHALLLAVAASFVDDLPTSIRMTRQGYDLLAGLNGTEGDRIRLLVRLAIDLRGIDDYGTAMRVTEDAERLATQTPGIDPALHGAILFQRAELSRQAGDLDQAMLAATKAVELSRDLPQRAERAMLLAEIHAEAGQAGRAQQVIRDVVAPVMFDPLVVGDFTAMQSRGRIASLQAYRQPGRETLAEIEGLMAMADRTAIRDTAIRRDLLRAESFVRYGLGQPRESLVAGRKALAMRDLASNERARVVEDRPLLETMVGAALAAAAIR